MRSSFRAGLAMLAAGLLGPIPAASVRAEAGGGVTVSEAWSRATPGGAKVASGYVTIRNAGPVPDRLLGGTADIAGRLEIHRVEVSGSVTRMRELESGLAIAPQAIVEFKPGGLHLMFQDLKRPLREGDRFTATLRFERAGEKSVEFKVEGVGAPARDDGRSHQHRH